MGNICIIGPRSSGKTTYLAGLAYWPDQRRANKKYAGFNIEASGDDAKKLKIKAKEIIRAGAALEPTVVDKKAGINALPLYQFTIEIQRLFQKKEQINLVVRDYPGEIFDELASSSNDPLHQEFIDECLVKDVLGCLILLPEWKRGTDDSYSLVLDRFTELMDQHDRAKDFRVAVAMSKCERGELWPGRLEPEIDLFGVHLRETKAILKKKILPQNLRYYALSTFGVLRRNDPRPNRIEEWGTDGRNSVLREANRWQPYGMISPLYWLSTGKRMREDA